MIILSRAPSIRDNIPFNFPEVNTGLISAEKNIFLSLSANLVMDRKKVSAAARKPPVNHRKINLYNFKIQLEV